MAIGDYTRINFNTGAPPPLNATNLNIIDSKLDELDTEMELKATIASPTFTGTPTLPTGTIATTQLEGDSTTAIATTAFVNTEVDTLAGNMDDALALKANLASPTFTGTPTLPTGTIATTQAVGNSTTAVATTAFVNAEIASDTDYLKDFRTYDSARAYALNDPVFYLGVPYKSLQAANTNHLPTTSPTYWEVTGGGAGAAATPGINFENGQFDAKQVIGWSVYNDGAAVAPVDGTGGTASVTFAYSSTTPLIGVGMGVLTKAAANEQGEGFSYDFTVDRGILQGPVKISFTYETSANYVDGDMGLYVYDITGAKLLYPSEVSILSSHVAPSQHEAVLLLNTSSSSYRLIFHVRTTSALSYTFKIDNVQVGTNNMVVGAAVGPTIQYPLTIGATTTAPTKGTVAEDIATWARHGDKMLWSYRYKQTSAGTAGNGLYLFPLPTGHEIDLTKHPIGSVVGSGIISNQILDTSVSTFSLIAVVYSATALDLRANVPTVSTNILNEIGGGAAVNLGNAYVRISLEASFTISGWSANVNLNGAMDDEFLFNTQATINTSDTTSFGYGKGGAAILANTVATYYDVQLQKPMQITDEPILEVRSKVDGSWIDADRASIPSLFAVLKETIIAYDPGTWYRRGVCLSKTRAQKITVIFFSGVVASTTYDDTGASASKPWSSVIAAADGYDRWRVRIKKGASSSEIPPVVKATMKLTVATTQTSGVIQFNSIPEDSHNGGVTGASSRYNIKVPGRYRASVQFYDSGVTQSVEVMYIRKNGVQDNHAICGGFATAGYGLAFSTSVEYDFVVGDYIDVAVNGDANRGRYVMLQITRIGS